MRSKLYGTTIATCGGQQLRSSPLLDPSAVVTGERKQEEDEDYEVLETSSTLSPLRSGLKFNEYSCRCLAVDGLFVCLLKAYTPADRTGSTQGFGC